MPNYYSFNTAQQLKFHLYDEFEEKGFYICRMRELPFIEVVQRLHPSVCLQSYCRIQECRRYPDGQVIVNDKQNEEKYEEDNPQEQKTGSWKLDVMLASCT